ncbi:MAG: hypothetical protein F4Y79_12090 [Gemmatimonadetes bacterium]|nr:hypothetical protein [Gemmatimonadota bacterium]
MAEVRQVNEGIRYEPEDKCPRSVAILSAVQMASPNIVMVVVFTTVVIRSSGETGAYLPWAVFMALITCGFTSIIQAFRGRIGTGLLILTGFNIPFIAISTLALEKGGPGLLAILTVVSTLVQLLLTMYLPLLRRIFTRTVSGTIVMLVAATAAPFLFNDVVKSTQNLPVDRVIVTLTISLLVGVLIILRAPQIWRLWIVGITILAGLVVAVPLGLYDNSGVVEAAYIGFPVPVWEGLDLTFGVEFWGLLPAFIFVGLVTFVKAVGDIGVIQRASHREVQAQDFRVVQGGLNAYSVGNLIVGFLGIPSATTPWALTATYVSLTGVATRIVGVYMGLFMIGVAFLPKLGAFLIAIPSPVLAAVYIIVFGGLFVEGAKVAFDDKIDHRKSIVIAVSIMVGLSSGSIAGFFDGFVHELLDSGVTVGSLTVIGMTLLVELTGSRRRKIQVPLELSALPAIDEFLVAFAEKYGWTESGQYRLRSVGEEMLVSLVTQDEKESSNTPRQLIMGIRMDDGVAEVEFLAASDGENIEDQIAYLGEDAYAEDDHEFSIRLLRHYASSVHHRKYEGIDVITARVENAM